VWTNADLDYQILVRAKETTPSKGSLGAALREAVKEYTASKRLPETSTEEAHIRRLRRALNRGLGGRPVDKRPPKKKPTEQIRLLAANRGIEWPMPLEQFLGLRAYVRAAKKRHKA
jgi:hypothetical protein